MHWVRRRRVQRSLFFSGNRFFFSLARPPNPVTAESFLLRVLLNSVSTSVSRLCRAGFGLWIDCDFQYGSSHPCGTYLNQVKERYPSILSFPLSCLCASVAGLVRPLCLLSAVFVLVLYLVWLSERRQVISSQVDFTCVHLELWGV